MDGIPINDDGIEKLNSEVGEGYTNLAKWIIALSTGAIAFGVSLVKPETSIAWKQELFFGLGLLGISIVIGGRYVRLRIDATLYNLEVIINTNRLKDMRNHPDDEQTVNGKNLKKSDLINIYNKKINERETKFDRINKDLIVLFKWQQILFYIGIGLILLFGVLSIQ